ncbi:hypothetical protein VPH35_071790 [Triticum aestivum]
MSNSCECCKRYWAHLHGKVKCFFTQIDSHSRHSVVIPESFVNYFGWKLSGTIELEAPNGNVYDVGITERKNKTLLRSGWEAFVDANHIVENDSLMFRYRGSCRFKVAVFDSSGCEKVVSCARILTNTSDQEPSTNSADISTSFSDAEDSPFEHESSESDDQTLPTPLYVLSGNCYVTEEDEANIFALAQEIQPEMPLLVAMMTKLSVKPYPDLASFCDHVIPKDYALAHFPHKNQTIYQTKFRVKSDGGRCNLKECGFARDNHLLEGDLCVFQPMTNRKGRTFKVMVHLLRKASIHHPSGKNGLTSKKNAPTLCIKEEPNDAIGSDLHIYIAVMTRSSILVSLSFAIKYSATYLRKGSGSLVLQVAGKSQIWHDEMRWTSFASDNSLREGDICLFELMKNEGGGGGGGAEEDDGLYHSPSFASFRLLTSLCWHFVCC